MGSSSFAKAEHSSPEIFQWLKTLPLAPEYNPTIQEFQDPISYIFKIEKEASKFGICKIIPPLPPQSKKSVILNLNSSLESLPHNNSINDSGNPNSCLPTFTTRQQQIGFCPRKQRPIQKSVWQSGEFYTLPQFEAKAKIFEKNYLKNISKRTVSPLEVETLYWKANGDRPLSVEYANDMPGSGFMPLKGKKTGELAFLSGTCNSNVGDSAWNMRGVARANGSLLKFMKEDIPGVTSPMVYVAMMFSWFAWHVEDHDLHSLNYLHMGSSKTWYGVPDDAALAFEEVIRVHGFGEEINPLVTFATLGEKTTVMSPEVLINAGVPCCRLVQNAGEFVVTFPRAYHCGFSHGFNCAEASNIATPEWLRFAKDAAIRRASINYPPMVSHFQLLYDLALSICSRVPIESNSEPRSSRLKDKKKGEGEMVVKQTFVQDVRQNNELLHTLGEGSGVVLLPQNSIENFVWSNLRVRSKYKVKPALPFSLYSSKESIKASDDIMLAKGVEQQKDLYSVKTNFGGSMSNSPQDMGDLEIEKGGAEARDGFLNRGFFSCVKCGIWTFACVAVVQPTESASRMLMSADYRFFDWICDAQVPRQQKDATNVEANHSCPDSFSGSMGKKARTTINTLKMMSDAAETLEVGSHIETKNESSALNLLAMTYGSSSESDEDDVQPNCPENNLSRDCSWGSRFHQDDSISPDFEQGYDSGGERGPRSKSDDEYYTKSCNSSVKFTEEDTLTSEKNYSPSFSRRCDEDSSRMHVFCLEHAVEVEKQLRPIGGVHIFLLCHPEYPKVESEAKKVAEELQISYVWKDIDFSEATKEDEERIHMALQSEEATPKNGDWTVKLGINLFYSAILSRSPLYNKQMPYNFVIYSVFGCISPSKSSLETKVHSRRKKLLVAGRWCGKVWMSNQVHPLLLNRDLNEEGIDNACVNSPEKVGRKGVAFDKGQTTTYTNRKVRKKRKSVSKSKIVKKMEVEPSKDDSGDNKQEFEIRSCVREPKSQSRPMKRLKHQEDEIPNSISENSEEDIGSNRGSLRSAIPFGLRSCSRKLKAGLKSTINKVKPKPKELMDSGSEGSLSDESEPEELMRTLGSPGYSHGRIPVNIQFDPVTKEEYEMDGGLRTRLRKRVQKLTQERETKTKPAVKRQVQNSIGKNAGPARKGPKMRLPVTRGPAMMGPTRKNQSHASVEEEEEEEEEEGEFTCDIEGCSMSFGSKEELAIHKRNVCPVKGCGKKFFAHKYLMQHRRVHMDDRPLKCPWKGCRMTFKWAWARTEHIRVHTGARPYVCNEPGCGQTFRFVSDFSRHKRKTGHSVKKIKK